jgi:uncharacterized membrane protein
MSAAKISHPIFLSEAVWFFGLGFFPVAVWMGQVNFFHKNYVAWVGCKWAGMLSLYSVGYVGLIKKENDRGFSIYKPFANHNSKYLDRGLLSESASLRFCPRSRAKACVFVQK